MFSNALLFHLGVWIVPMFCIMMLMMTVCTYCFVCCLTCDYTPPYIVPPFVRSTCTTSSTLTKKFSSLFYFHVPTPTNQPPHSYTKPCICIHIRATQYAARKIQSFFNWIKISCISHQWTLVIVTFIVTPPVHLMVKGAAHWSVEVRIRTWWQ